MGWRWRWLVLGGAAAACSGPPLVDMTDIDPVVYQRDLDACEAQSRGYDAAGPLVAGALMGATIGTGLGAFAGGTAGTTVAEGVGAGGGAAVGAGASAAANQPLAVPPPPSAPSQTVPQCLEAHGYKVLTPAAY